MDISRRTDFYISFQLRYRIYKPDMNDMNGVSAYCMITPGYSFTIPIGCSQLVDIIGFRCKGYTKISPCFKQLSIKANRNYITYFEILYSVARIQIEENYRSEFLGNQNMIDQILFVFGMLASLEENVESSRDKNLLSYYLRLRDKWIDFLEFDVMNIPLE